MLMEKFIKILYKFEDPKHPLMGPYVKGVCFIGLWQTGSRPKTLMIQIFIAMALLFIVTEFVYLYSTRHDLNAALTSFSLTAPSSTGGSKIISFILCKSQWIKLVNAISQEEITEIQKQKPKTLKIMKKYINYARLVTYTYCTLICVTLIIFITIPFLKYLISSTYRENVQIGIEPYPKILYSWFPFNDMRMPGYIFATATHIIFPAHGAAAIAIFDSMAVTIMSFLKGQLCILRSKCMEIFEGDIKNSKVYMAKIIECHRHHNFVLEQYELFNSLLSPVMFLYVLVCSMTICCSVIQLTLSDASAYQKLWIIQFCIGQFFELLIYCWHANEVYLESRDVDRGIFAGNWWKADVRLKRHIILLAGKLNRPLTFRAGPFACLSLPTFLNIIQYSYSFYTMITQLHVL